MGGWRGEEGMVWPILQEVYYRSLFNLSIESTVALLTRTLFKCSKLCVYTLVTENKL